MNGWIVVSIALSMGSKGLQLMSQDFDGGLIGSTITQAYLNNTGQKEQISWYVVPPSEFPNGESDIADAIVNERAWAAITSVYLLLLPRHLAYTHAPSSLGRVGSSERCDGSGQCEWLQQPSRDSVCCRGAK